ncbi:MAG: divergent PAP2 family protein, partial [Firmicutes bacterium]|nr:divergent PAP2 family protein [Bacillota bacterium]
MTGHWPTMWTSLGYNRALEASIAAIVTAQFLKIFTSFRPQRRVVWSRMVHSGGLPSSHSALVASLSTALGRQYGWGSPFFALSCVLGLIVVYDAAGIRRAVGLHAQYLNQVREQGGSFDGKKFSEMVGHTPFEVLTGIGWGV